MSPLAKYIFKRFFLYVFSINAGLTLLFNLIEFFEKMVRVEHTTAATIALFVALNLVPTFFENLALSSWLATCLVIKEMHQHNEWETLTILNISFFSVTRLFVISGILLAGFSFVGKEFVAHTASQAAETFRMKQFKHARNKKLYNQWFDLGTNTFCHINYLDLDTSEGSELQVLYLDASFTLKKVTTASTFTINKETNTVVLPDNKLVLPSLFAQLYLHAQTPSFAQMTQLLLTKSALPDQTHRTVLNSYLERIFSHTLLIFYPLLTMLLFFLFPLHPYARWIAILITYPVITALMTLSSGLVEEFSIQAGTIIPYVLLATIALILFRTIRKKARISA